MNAQYVEQGRNAYRSGDWAGAVQLFNAAKDATEPMGEVDHLRGNALMKLGRYKEAAVSYDRALNDTAYGKRGALLTNQGKAYAAAGDYQNAVQSFNEALRDASYTTRYKSYLGLGRALLALGQIAEAGTAFRQAAIDGANPAPSSALSELGNCFVLLGRPADAIESYRTALDFAGPRDDVRAINAGMGQALFAANRPADAIEAFDKASADGIYQLTPEQASDYASAQQAVQAIKEKRQTASYDGGPAPVDPLDPLGKSGSFMPDPSDTGFFTMSESELIQQDRKNMKVRRKKRHIFRKILVVFLVLIILALIGGGVAYTQGFGFPTQQASLNGLFQAVTDNTDPSQYLDPNLSDDAKAMLVSSIPSDATPTISSMDRSMTETTADVSVELSRGGTQEYTVTFARGSNFVGWVVSSVDIEFGSADSSNESSADDSSASSTDEGSTTDTSAETNTDTAANTTVDNGTAAASADDASAATSEGAAA